MASDIIRPAVPADAGEICRLNREFNGDDAASAEQIHASLSASGPELCLVCQRGGRLVGFICGICFDSLCYTDPVGQVTELFVQENARRNGIGQALLHAMIETLRRKGVKEILLLTGADNAAAQALYEKCGFIPEDERCYQKTID